MTLIIGCVTKNYGIIAGDTQLSSGDLPRGNFTRSTQIKVHQYGPDFMMGILGKWGYIDPMKDGTGTQIDYFHTLNREIQKIVVKDKFGYLNKFLPGKPNIEATAIYVKKELSFGLDCVTSDGNTKTIKTINIGGKKLMFNEPFYKTSPDFIENKIHKFCDKHKLSNSLVDSIFLINNIILEIIVEGKTLDISVDGETIMNIPNSVGGYVTMQVMTGEIHYRNCLHSAYQFDCKVLLDKTTYPFATTVDRNKTINYVDNLAMLAKASNDSRVNLTKELREVLVKQIKYASTEEIIDNTLVNDLKDEINDKYKMKLTKYEEKNTSETVWDGFLVDDGTEENHEFYKRFFK